MKKSDRKKAEKALKGSKEGISKFLEVPKGKKAKIIRLK